MVRRWIANMESNQLTSLFPKGSKVRYVVGCLRDRARELWEVVSDSLGAPDIEAMTWSDFMSRFRAKFVLVVELQQLA